VDNLGTPALDSPDTQRMPETPPIRRPVVVNRARSRTRGKVPPACSAPDWPTLGALRLSSERNSQRSNSIGGSDANIILSGDTERIRQLWLEKRGEAEAADLSSNLSVMLGCWTEPFNRQWFEQLSGETVTSRGKVFSCSRYDWRSCTVDGLIERSNAVWEAKHTNAFTKPDEVLERYMPQLQHNMAVTDCDRAMLSVIFGNHKFEIFEVAADWLYQIELLAAEEHFWECVKTGREPVAFEPPPPPRPVGTREVCLEGNNSWASAAFDWLKHKDAAKTHATACTSIKSLVEDDVARAFGHGIEAKRSKAGAISIREFAL
jgi:predicted phage-related endonuclease